MLKLLFHSTSNHFLDCKQKDSNNGRKVPEIKLITITSGYLENLKKTLEGFFPWIPCNFLVSGSQGLGRSF